MCVCILVFFLVFLVVVVFIHLNLNKLLAPGSARIMRDVLGGGEWLLEDVWLIVSIYKAFSNLINSAIPSYISLTASNSVNPMRRLLEMS